MNTKLIFSPTVARKLLKRGNVIVDIKPKKGKENESVFIFECTDKLKNDLSCIKR